MDDNEFYLALYQKSNREILEILQDQNSHLLRALGLARIGQVSVAKQLLSTDDENLLIGLNKQYYLETKLVVSHSQMDDQSTYLLALEVNKEFPGSFFSNYYLAKIYKKRVQFELAYIHLNNCLVLLPEDEELNYEAASIAMSLKRNEVASQHSKFVKNIFKKALLISESKIIFSLVLIVIMLGLLWLIGNRFVIVGLFVLTIVLWMSSRKKGDLVQASLLSKLLIGFVIYYLGFVIQYNFPMWRELIP